MERLEAKKIKGRTYYYYSRWAKVEGRCRRVWQRYLGKLEDIVQAVEGGPTPVCADVFQWGLPEAMWRECQRAEVVNIIDRHCTKRKQGLSSGEYLAVAAVNRAIHPESKRSMWEWFSKTALVRHLPQASTTSLSSQRFWDHMGRIDPSAAAAVWKELLHGVVRREGIDLSSVSYDGTNFYTFIDTFNTRCEIARRGKNKQGRNNLRQVSYALFCCADGQLPLYYDVYDGNRNDAKQFPQMVRRFHQFFAELTGDADVAPPQTTVIFDKGNNSKDNFRLLDELQMKFVGSLKLDQHRDLAEVANDDAQFTACTSADLEGAKAFRVQRTVAGQPRTLVVVYNQNLFDAQWQTVQNDIAAALEKLRDLQSRLRDRAAGVIKGGRTPTVASIEKQGQGFLSRQHMKSIIRIDVQLGDDGVPRLNYVLDSTALDRLAQTYLGKNLLITNRPEWDNERIIRAYRSQFLIESVFKQMKDRETGNWWPLHHWTDSKIKVHALYCTMALLLRAILYRRVRQAGLNISMQGLLSELNGINEVVNIYPKKRRPAAQQTVLSRTNDTQDKLLSILKINHKNAS